MWPDVDSGVRRSVGHRRTLGDHAGDRERDHGALELVAILLRVTT